MHLDVHHLRDFYYRSQLGRAVQKGLRDELVARWGPARGLCVAGYGFAVPLLRPFLGQATRVIGLMPAPQGVMHWPADGANHSVLADEARWPLPNDSIDRLVMLHGLETSDRPMALLDEAHRALAPQGRAVFVVPSRSGLWARRDATPFGYGRPGSRAQIERLLRECGFTPVGHAAALFFPPLSHRFWLRAARGIERAGRRFAPERFGGALLVEAIRSDAAPRQPGLPVEERRPLAVLEGVPQGRAQPAWRVPAQVPRGAKAVPRHSDMPGRNHGKA
ncbi:MAG: methyltransferase domain-containing protein [Pararhodobacter sp.]|nr:methyltransferase domain-containing protein [Pararhodobacter sp.]